MSRKKVPFSEGDRSHRAIFRRQFFQEQDDTRWQRSQVEETLGGASGGNKKQSNKPWRCPLPLVREGTNKGHWANDKQRKKNDSLLIGWITAVREVLIEDWARIFAHF